MAREITTKEELALAVGQTADTTEVIRDLLEGKETGDGSALEQAMEQIADYLESIDARIARIEDQLNISDEQPEEN